MINVADMVHGFMEKYHYSQHDLDGQSAFYYAMEHMAQYFNLTAKEAFEIAEKEMNYAWGLHLNRMQEDFDATRLQDAYTNSYDNFDDLPW